MTTEKLSINKQPDNNDYYMASYSGDEGNEAYNLAFKKSLPEAIIEALAVWGLNEDEVYIEANN